MIKLKLKKGHCLWACSSTGEVLIPYNLLPKDDLSYMFVKPEEEHDLISDHQIIVT